MTLKGFIDEFYGNNPIALDVYHQDETEIYEDVRDIPAEVLGMKILAVYPWSSSCIAVTVR